MKTGDGLVLHVQGPVFVLATTDESPDGAFAAILSDGSVVSWGSEKYVEANHAVQDQAMAGSMLGDIWDMRDIIGIYKRDVMRVYRVWGMGFHIFIARKGPFFFPGYYGQAFVTQVQGSGGAFAAILSDGSVVTWGSVGHGGDSTAVQDQLKNVKQIQASDYAYAAILGDGSVVTWGDADCGGDSSAVQDQLRNVRQVQYTDYAFAAILADGSVVTWGNAFCGGDSSAVQDRLRDVQQIQGNNYAFAAILVDGSVVTWGNAFFGGDSSAVQDRLRNVQQIQSSEGAFAAILGDGSVVTWGSATTGGDSSAVQYLLRHWVAVKELELSYYIGETLLFTIYTHYGNLI